MRVPQHLSGALAVRRRSARLRLCAGQEHALAPRHPRRRGRHRRARGGNGRGCGSDQDRSRCGAQGPPGQDTVSAAARLPQPRRGVAAPASLGASQARDFQALFHSRAVCRRLLPARRRRTDRGRVAEWPFYWVAALCVGWYGAEVVLARSAGWPSSPRSIIAWIVRDLMLPVLWVLAWTGGSFVWRGNQMTVDEKPPTIELTTQ